MDGGVKGSFSDLIDMAQYLRPDMRLISFVFHMDGILEPMGRWGPGKG